jgi:hypothetical protein
MALQSGLWHICFEDGEEDDLVVPHQDSLVTSRSNPPQPSLLSLSEVTYACIYIRVPYIHNTCIYKTYIHTYMKQAPSFRIPHPFLVRGNVCVHAYMHACSLTASRFRHPFQVMYACTRITNMGFARLYCPLLGYCCCMCAHLMCACLPVYACIHMDMCASLHTCIHVLTSSFHVVFRGFCASKKTCWISWQPFLINIRFGGAAGIICMYIYKYIHINTYIHTYMHPHIQRCTYCIELSIGERPTSHLFTFPRA